FRPPPPLHSTPTEWQMANGSCRRPLPPGYGCAGLAWGSEGAISEQSEEGEAFGSCCGPAMGCHPIATSLQPSTLNSGEHTTNPAENPNSTATPLSEKSKLNG